MVTFIVVISSGLKASQESHEQHSGFYWPVPSLCMKSCLQCGCSLLLLPGLLEGTAPHHSLLLQSLPEAGSGRGHPAGSTQATST